MKGKCNEFHIPSDVSQKIVEDIFGANVGGVFTKGLVDASGDNDFQRKQNDVILSWQNCSVPNSANTGSFVQWFMTKSHAICDSMLKPIREECGWAVLRNHSPRMQVKASISCSRLVKT